MHINRLEIIQKFTKRSIGSGYFTLQITKIEKNRKMKKRTKLKGWEV